MISASEQSHVLRRAMDYGLLSDTDTTVAFYFSHVLNEKLDEVNAHFKGHDTLHAVAVKTNPVKGVLDEIVRVGHGLEAASIIEVKMALAAGCPVNKVIFDSPAKTRKEISWCMDNLEGAHVNANCLEELYRYPIRSGLNLGLRINVQQSSGSDAFLDVSGEVSKFGEPIDNEDEIVKAAKQYAELNTLHIHQGSQNRNVEKLLRGIERVIDLAHAMNKALGKNQITTLNIGGGFAVNYSQGQPWRIEELYKPLERLLAEKGRDFKIITELGRFYHAHSGFTASRCEYVMQRGNTQVAVLHAGADLFLRECYVPEARVTTFRVFSPAFDLKNGNEVNTHLAGPLCFGGDFTARDISLPKIEEGDYVVFNDSGANSLALWSMHCSRAAPAVLLYDKHTGRIERIKDRQKDEDVMRFW